MEKPKLAGQIVSILTAGRNILDEAEQTTDNLRSQGVFRLTRRSLRHFSFNTQHIGKEGR